MTCADTIIIFSRPWGMCDLNDESNVEEKANLGKSRKKTKIRQKRFYSHSESKSTRIYIQKTGHTVINHNYKYTITHKLY